ncbi:MAG TPA: recombination mediator RecR [Polyangia bacterium]|nr:recombination mediator RecR [Polyangia bacterium]
MADPISRLITELSKLPGIGEKTASRLAFHILRAPGDYARDLAQALVEVKDKIRLCSTCMNLTERDPCALCSDARRDPGLVAVVATPPDLYAIERTGGFRGRYHVLHGVLSPLEGIGPDDLRIKELLGRVAARGGEVVLKEIIVATSPNVEGEATALYLAKVLRPLGVRVTRIASGLAVGGELEYADGVTITRALEARREM